MTTKRLGVMLDAESLATTTDAAIMQIAAVPFDLDTGAVTGPSLITGLDVAHQIHSLGRRFDNRTLVWWLQQNEEAQASVASSITKALLADNDSLLLSFHNWMRHEITVNGACEVWASGSAFDIPNLESLLAQYGIQVPWEFHTVRDLRTLRAFLNIHKDSVPEPRNMKSAVHDALWDCHWQINQYRACMEKISAVTGVELEDIRHADAE